jgi:hypothetical protein
MQTVHMKYLGVIAFIVLTAWTWNIVHSETNMGFETHSGIQDKLAVLIQETVKAKRPASSDIKIEKIWTEVIQPGKVKAHFLYSFKDSSEEGSTLTTIQGEGLLERQPDDGSGLDRWSLMQVRTTNDAIVFEDGLVVTAEDDQSKDEQKTTE